VHTELRILEAAKERTISFSEPLEELTQALRNVNAALWTIEDEIRQCECRADFGSRFVELARSVYKRNDERAAIKKRINLMLGSAIVEEKSYGELGDFIGLSTREANGDVTWSHRERRLAGFVR
jgi:hypothetical protein